MGARACCWLRKRLEEANNHDQLGPYAAEVGGGGALSLRRASAEGINLTQVRPTRPTSGARAPIGRFIEDCLKKLRHWLPANKLARSAHFRFLISCDFSSSLAPARPGPQPGPALEALA